LRLGLQVFLGILISLAAIAAHAAQPSSAPAPTSQAYAVKDTFNNRAFEYQSRLLERRDGFSVYRWTYPSPVATSVEQNNTIRADFYLPDDIRPGDSNRPAIIVLDVLDGDMRLTDVACAVLARRRVVAVMPVLPCYGERAKAEGWKALLRDPTRLALAAAEAATPAIAELDLESLFDFLAHLFEIGLRALAEEVERAAEARMRIPLLSVLIREIRGQKLLAGNNCNISAPPPIPPEPW
jgi:hypothetical protein